MILTLHTHNTIMTLNQAYKTTLNLTHFQNTNSEDQLDYVANPNTLLIIIVTMSLWIPNLYILSKTTLITRNL